MERLIAVLERYAKDANGKTDWFICPNGDGTWTGALGEESAGMSGEPTWYVEATGLLVDVLLQLVVGCWAWSVNSSQEGPEFFRILAGVN